MILPDLQDLLSRLIRRLDQAPIEYMVVGSFARSMHGEPRATQDVDIVMEADNARLDRLLSRAEWLPQVAGCPGRGGSAGEASAVKRAR